MFSASSTEYRVVLNKAGINSVDYYYNLDRARDRKKKLRIKYPNSVILVQKREITEWVKV